MIMRGIMQRLHRRPAQAVDRDRRNRVGDLRQQRGVTGNVEALFEGLLDTAPVNIVNRTRLKRRVARQKATHQVRREIFRTNVAKGAAF